MQRNVPRVAIVHDFLYCYGGAERVLEQIVACYPEADLFSLFDFLPADARGFLGDRPVKSSFLQRMPFARRIHRHYLPLMPLAVEQLDLSAYDLVISSSYIAAKGVITRPGQLHVCYCHSPVRFAWDLQHRYLSEAGLHRGLRSLVAGAILQYIRNWDARSANGVDWFVTNSRFVTSRIAKFYRRPSTTIYPPVDVDWYTPGDDASRQDVYLTASRLVPYKRIDLIIEAFNRTPQRKLIVIGDGPERKRLAAMARPNVTLLGQQSAEGLRDHMRRARAFVFAAEEDFGIVPLEAQACGTPVIAFGAGGSLETVVPDLTGLLFPQQTAASLLDAVERFEHMGDLAFNARVIRAHAERFNTARFREQFTFFVDSRWDEFLSADGISSHPDCDLSYGMQQRADPARDGETEADNQAFPLEPALITADVG